MFYDLVVVKSFLKNCFVYFKFAKRSQSCDEIHRVIQSRAIQTGAIQRNGLIQTRFLMLSCVWSPRHSGFVKWMDVTELSNTRSWLTGTLLHKALLFLIFIFFRFVNCYEILQFAVSFDRNFTSAICFHNFD